ncbi:MAG TPA: TIGR03032 family protein, partial [Chroococcidiopsis sp.]
NHGEALTRLGQLYLRQKCWDQSRAYFQQARAVAPDSLAVLDGAIQLSIQSCCWEDLEPLVQQLWEVGKDTISTDIALYNSLFLPLSAGQLQTLADHYAAAVKQRVRPLRDRLAFALPNPHSPRQSQPDAASAVPIRLGYVSGDYRNQAVAHLIYRLFELHQRPQFEVYAYSLGINDHSEYRHRFERDCDLFRDVQGHSAEAIARQIYADGIDILIDLEGYTEYAQTEIYALRPAPLIVSYLGHSGTMGGDTVDYVITDAVITPPGYDHHLSERRLYLPECYQINNNQQPKPQPVAQRAAYGLPDEGVVFCGFNKIQKLQPEIFAVWMRILAQVPNSVLWLFDGGAEINARLQEYAQQHGIEGDRLIFAPLLPKVEHLQRLPCADLFLDTLYHNAHVTGSDFLWAGVPIITCPTDSMAGRVAASLLTAVDLPETIASSLADYERLAVYLATDDQARQALRQRLIDGRLSCSLFNSDRTVRHLEAGYALIWQHYQAGTLPDDVYVEALPPSRLEGDRTCAVSTPEIRIGDRHHPNLLNICQGNNPKLKIWRSPNQEPAIPLKTVPPKTMPAARPAKANPATPLSAIPSVLDCNADSGFQQWLSQAQGSLAIASDQGNALLLLGWDGQRVTVLPRQIQAPTAIAVQGNQMAIAAAHEVLYCVNSPTLAHYHPAQSPGHSGNYDALFLPRATYFTGHLSIADLDIGDDGIWLVNPDLSSLCTVSAEFSAVPRWQPSFISQVLPDDRCHLSGLALVNGKPGYVTAWSNSDRPQGWRSQPATSGIVIDVESGQTLIEGLCRPQSPRWHNGSLWFLNTGRGELCRVNAATAEATVVCQLPGIPRGLALVDDYAIVGLSMAAPDLDPLLIQTGTGFINGVAIANLHTGTIVGTLTLHPSQYAIAALQFLPGLLRTNVLTPDKALAQTAITTPSVDYWHGAAVPTASSAIPAD